MSYVAIGVLTAALFAGLVAYLFVRLCRYAFTHCTHDMTPPKPVPIPRAKIR